MATEQALDRYVLVPGSVREGGMGRVYQAFDLQTATTVAVKAYAGEFENSIARTSFQRETESLGRLKHPNIAKLLDAGEDPKLGPVIVLEWFNKDLGGDGRARFRNDWEVFYNFLGKPLLGALAYAHERDVVHRDVSPGNVMFSDQGVPKLVDFGISKIKNWLKSGKTLAGFNTPIFSPPEADQGYTNRDVFSFAALAVYCLTDKVLQEIQDLKGLRDTLFQLKIPQTIMDVLSKSLSFDPLERQHNCCELLARLDYLSACHKKASIEKALCSIVVPRSKLSLLAERTRATSAQAGMEILEEDLAIPGISTLPKSAPGHFSLFGSEYILQVQVDDESGGSNLRLNSLNSYPSSEVERRRRKSWDAPVRFKLSDRLTNFGGAETVEWIQSSVEAHESEARAAELFEKEDRLFFAWNGVLSALTELTRLRSPDISYSFVQANGRRATFHVEGAIIDTESLVGQERVAFLSDGRALGGVVDAATSSRVVLFIPTGELEMLPLRGVLRFNSKAMQVATDRQRVALDSIRSKESPRPDWRDLLSSPEICRPVLQPIGVEFFQAKLDEAKQKAVQVALASEDMVVVQGPPGTGKTKFIVELILQFLRLYPGSRILLSSQTHVALDNALERLATLDPNLETLRIATNDSKVGREVLDLLPAPQLDRWRRNVIDRSTKYLVDWATEHSLSVSQVRVALALEQLFKSSESVESRVQGVEEAQANINKGPKLDDDLTPLELDQKLNLELKLAEAIGALDSARLRAKEALERLRSLGTDGAELATWGRPEQEEWRDSLLADAQSFELKNLLEIQADWHSQFGYDPDFKNALFARARVVAGTCVGLPAMPGFQGSYFDLCIIDEASKATATEVLVPISRAERCVIVGDPRQLPPLQDELCCNKEILEKYGLDEAFVRSTLFDLLINNVPESCKTILSVQHRMAPSIGSLISQCFYDGQLTNGPECKSHLTPHFGAEVVWFSTSALAGHGEEVTGPAGTTFFNSCEAREIKTILTKLDSHCISVRRSCSVCVLSGYSAQVDYIRQMLASSESRFNNITVEVNSVDAFQGREADVCIYSVTRSNREGEVGFLAQSERVNVALSRGKEALLIVGDHSFVRRLSGKLPVRRVLDFIESRTADCKLEELGKQWKLPTKPRS